MLAIYKRELKSYFQSMVGCVFVAFLLVFTGIYFVAYNLSAGYPYFSYSLAGSLIVFIVGIPITVIIARYFPRTTFHRLTGAVSRS